MAVKIIKEGNTKEVFEGWCRYCRCEFEYEMEDVADSCFDPVADCDYHSIKCPWCGVDLCIEERRK